MFVNWWKQFFAALKESARHNDMVADSYIYGFDDQRGRKVSRDNLLVNSGRDLFDPHDAKGKARHAGRRGKGTRSVTRPKH